MTTNAPDVWDGERLDPRLRCRRCGHHGLWASPSTDPIWLYNTDCSECGWIDRMVRRPSAQLRLEGTRVKLSTAHRVLRYPVLQIAQLGVDDDGGVRALEYLVTDDLPEWPELKPTTFRPNHPIDPPPLPRSEPADVWVTVASIGLAVWGMLGAVGLVEVIKWVLRGG